VRWHTSLRTYQILVGVLTGVTLIALVLLWPHGESKTDLEFGNGTPTEKAEVEGVEKTKCTVPLENATCYTATIKLQSGPESGQSATIDLTSRSSDTVVDPGDKIRVAAIRNGSGPTIYSLIDFQRGPSLILLSIAFALLVIIFGRLRGAMSLVGLGVSLAIVLFFIVPAILHNKPPLAVALAGSMAVMLATIFLAHGTGPKSIAAILGTSVSLLLVGLLAVIFTSAANLTGFTSEEASLLSASNSGISISGLVVAGIIIGALGVLDDVTISQASTVLALKAANPKLRIRQLYARAIDVGRDHVSATVNTLVLAYVGSSLPVLLILGSGEVGFGRAVNMEVVAKEVVATLVGSIGLIAAVPITTILAALLASSLSRGELIVASSGGGHSH
jgi:uncharacterized membrane protein